MVSLHHLSTTSVKWNTILKSVDGWVQLNIINEADNLDIYSNQTKLRELNSPNDRPVFKGECVDINSEWLRADWYLLQRK